MQKRLWPDTFVDVEHNLNTAINKIREALGDSAENPRFVETLPRRGYRFIAPVDGAAATAGSLAPVNGEGSGLAGREDPASTAFPRRERLQRRRFELLAVVAGAVLVSVGLYAWTRHSRPLSVTRSTQITSDSQAKTASYASELLSPLVSDGSRLHFMEGPLGNKKLAQVSTGGGEATLLSTAFRVRRVMDVSPDRHELLALSSDHYLRTETPLMILPLPAGSPRRIGDLLAHDASWSPDGSRIAYANGRDVYVAQKDGRQALKLATVPGTAWWPRWSPDGRGLRFTVSDALNMYKLWEVSIDGSDLHRLLPDLTEPFVQCCGSWTPDGRYFVFASSSESRSQLWAIREQRGFLTRAYDLTQLTTGPMSMFAPLLSSDGNKLFAVAVQQRGQLMRYDIKLSQFAPYLSGVSAENVDFSKDGQWVTYVAYPEGTLWRSRADGTERLQLTLPPMQVAISRWSPDGKRIGFLAQAATGKPFKIYFIAADGGIPQQAIPGEHNDGEPSWSPDGNSVVFAPLYWLEGDGRKSLQLLDVKTGHVTPVPGSDGLFSGRWSPDARHIAALTTDPSQTLVLFDLQTQERRELRKTVAYPNWSRDGRYICFDDPYGDEPGLYRVRISDGEVEKLTTLDPRVLNWAIVGKWTGLGPDDSPLVLRDTSVEEIYALDVQLP